MNRRPPKTRTVLLITICAALIVCVNAEFGTNLADQKKDGDDVHNCTGCTPSCGNDTTTADECSTRNRTVTRPDCPCCIVCARQAGQSCDDVTTLCDVQLGLRCDNATNTCLSPFGLRAALVTHNSTVLRWTDDVDHVESRTRLRWRPEDREIAVAVARHLEPTDNDTDWTSLKDVTVAENDDGGSGGGGAITIGGLAPNETVFLRVSDGSDRHEVLTVTTKVGCVENDTSFGVGESYEIGCRQRCACNEDGRAKCRDRCPPSRSGCRLIGPDPNDACCSRFTCDEDVHQLQSPNGDDMARVLLTNRSPDSLTIAWDDFKVPGPNFEFGYVVEYRRSSVSVEDAWTRIQVGNVPITTIRHLHPNTAYDVRVFVWEDMESKRMSTEVVVLHTEDGCVWRNETVSVGDTYNQDCDARCRCLGNDTSECSDRCVEPMRAASATIPTADNCTVFPVSEDRCCMLVECPRSAARDHPNNLLGSATRQDHVKQTRTSECPTTVPDVGGVCRSTCKSDVDCASREQKCCLTVCGSTACTAPVTVMLPVADSQTPTSTSTGRHTSLDRCSGRSCGRNAICQHRSTPLEQCRCLPGFVSDANGIGCHSASKSPLKAGCTFGNATYLPGETFFNGCEYKCRCNNNEGVYEMLCQPRCLQREDKPRLLDPACQLKRDPVDSCCKIFVCETASENDADREGAHRSGPSHKDSWITIDDKDSDSDINQPVNKNSTIAKDKPVERSPLLNVTTGNNTLLDDDSHNTFEDYMSNTTTETRLIRKDLDYGETNSSFNGTSSEESNSTVDFDDAASVSNSTSSEKDVRRLQDGDTKTSTMVSTYVDQITPATTADRDVNTASIQQILPIGPTNVRLQIAMSPSIMEMLFMDSEGVAVLYTNNLTSDLLLWDRHPLIVRHNVAFVTVDRSDVAVETVVSDLEPNREYYFAVVVVRQPGDGQKSKLEYQRLGEVQATVTVQLEEGMCEFMGKTFGPGERLYDDCQAVCDCLPGQRVRCEALVCPGQLGPDRSGCLEWHVDSTFVARAPHCCPDVACKYGSTCMYGGSKFRNLETIPRDLVPECDKDCKCVAGNITCSQRCPPIDATNAPTDLGCEQPILAPIPDDEVEGCCKRWICESDANGENEAIGGRVPTTTSMTTASAATTTAAVVAFTAESTTQDTAANNNTTNSTAFDSDANETGVGNGSSATNTSITAVDSVDVPPLQQQQCIYENQTYRVNEKWEVGRGHRQKSCTCVSQMDGTMTAECQGGCPPILTHHLSLIPDCPPGNVVIWDVPELCPYVVCNKTDAGRGVKNVTAVPLNATSMRIDFVLPSIYVGLYGHAEILYTMDLMHSEDTTTWSKEVFSGPSNQFESARLTHEMNGMQPDTEYYLKVQVVIKNTKNVDSSDVITVRTPPLPTTTTTTTTTTLPPKISLDARIAVSDVQATSAKVSWRAFKASERRFVDGVQLQYRRRAGVGGDGIGGTLNSRGDEVPSAAGDAGVEPLGQWSLTTLIHRDVTSYVLADLRPDSDYDVDLIFVPPANVSTEVLSVNLAGFHTMPIHDDFEFNLTLTVDKVTSQSVELIWTGVPYPEHKYVNVYRILYVTAETPPRHEEPSYMYRPPKGNQFQLTVEGLVSSTNYTVWMEAYLINGRTRTSNNITVLTKLGPSTSKVTEKEKHVSLGGQNGIGGGGNGDQVEGNVGEDYVAALIVVAIIAALVTLGFVVLLVILLRKQSSAKAPITTGSASPAVKSHSAYDNPTYKDSLD